MFVYFHCGTALFQTPYDEKYDLVQKFSGVTCDSVTYNSHIDFTEAGLIERDKEKGWYDPWHLDVPFSMSTDDASPCIINKTWLGASHGQPCCIQLYVPSHGKTLRDVGSIWKDENDVTFTLLRVINEDYLLLISLNMGTLLDYQFITKIEGALSYVSDGENTAPIAASEEQTLAYLSRAYRFTKKRLVGVKDGKEKTIVSYMECDTARMEEDYEIVNPATVAPALTAARPAGGYTHVPDLPDFGETMFICRNTYHILEDGTVLCEFNHEKVMDIKYERCMGMMYQEKLDIFGGGTYRYLSKTLPFSEGDNGFDFSTPHPIATTPYPQCFYVTPEYWENPASPPDRVIDYFRDKEGHDRLGFVLGFLPLYDGAPEKRLEHLEHSIMLYRSRKVYPTFMSGDLKSTHGIAYKKFFKTEKDKASVYSVKAEGKTYIYMDFFEENTLKTPIAGNISLYEKSDGVVYDIRDGFLSASGKKGYAVFICD